MRGRLESGFVSVCQELGVAWLLSKFGPLKGKRERKKRGKNLYDMSYKLVDTSGWKIEISNILFFLRWLAQQRPVVCTWVSECMGPVRSNGELHNWRLDC